MRTSGKFQPGERGLSWVDSDAYDNGVHVRLRMPVLELADGLTIYSPVAIDEEIAARIAAMGPVRHIIAPNLNHTIFAGAAAERYPEATLHGVEGMSPKRPKLDWAPLPASHDELELLPLQGVPFTNEVVLFHRPSETLICADLVQNVHDEEEFLTRQLYRAIGAWKTTGPNRWWRFNTRDRAAFSRSVDQMLEWQPRRIVMSHGDVIEADATEILREAMSYAR